MRELLMKAGAISLAVGALGALMVNAGFSSGCGSSQPAPQTQTPTPEPPVTTKAGAAEPTAAEPTAAAPTAPAPTPADPTASTAPAPPPSANDQGLAKPAPRYLPATKSGGFFPREQANPAPPQQQTAPQGNR